MLLRATKAGLTAQPQGCQVRTICFHDDISTTGSSFQVMG